MNLKNKKYQKYKDSGIEWIGEIPEHWDKKRLRFLIKLNKGKKPADDTESNDGIPYLTMDFLRGQKNSTNYVPSDESVIVKDGEILLLWDGANAGEFVEGCNGILSSTMAKITIDSYECSSKYMYFFLKSFEPLLRSLTVGMGIPHVDGDVVRNCVMPIVECAEQRAIADYLDTKTALIDKLIATKKRQIELLKEQRQAVINQAVTKGLDPNVEMKDSGIEWLGEIPKHWGVKKLKYVTRQIIDGTHFTPTYLDEGIPFLRVTDIQNKTIDLDEVKYISSEEHNDLNKRCNPEKGDLLLSKNGTIGITKVIDWDYPFSIFVSLCLIKFTDQMNPYYFSFFFQSNVVKEQIFSSSKTTSVTNLHLDKIRELVIVAPSVSEQNAIIKYLDNELQGIQSTISKAEQQIELLREYRTALISEAVTGKIDVRETA